MNGWIGAVLLASAAAAGAAACDDGDEDREEPAATPAPSPAASPAIDSAAIANATYMSQFTESGFVELSDGEFADRSQRLTVTLIEWATGNLDDDAAEEAAAVLGTTTGGTGDFIDLAVLDRRAGEPVNAATLFLGDRLRIHTLEVVDGTIRLNATMHAPEDPMCCPTLRADRRFQFSEGGLVEIDPPEGAMIYDPPMGEPPGEPLE